MTIETWFPIDSYKDIVKDHENIVCNVKVLLIERFLWVAGTGLNTFCRKALSSRKLTAHARDVHVTKILNFLLNNFCYNTNIVLSDYINIYQVQAFAKLFIQSRAINIMPVEQMVFFFIINLCQRLGKLNLIDIVVMIVQSFR